MKRCTVCHRYSCSNIAVCQEVQRLQKEHSEQRKEERQTRSLEQCLYGDAFKLIKHTSGTNVTIEKNVYKGLSAQ